MSRLVPNSSATTWFEEKFSSCAQDLAGVTLTDLSKQESVSEKHAVQVTVGSYSRLAATYAAATRDFSRYPGLKGEIREFVASLDDGIIADIGSGSGRDATFIASLGHRVVAVDSSYSLLHTLTASEVKVCMVCGDVFALPVRSNTFAGAILSGVLLHLPRRLCPQALAEIRRVLSVGGHVLISMKHGHGEGWRTTNEFPLPRWFTYYDPTEFAQICRDVGLSIRRSWVIDREDWFTIVAARD
jgi:tRNA (uracil-5-)-methyltransferase TRM9